MPSDHVPHHPTDAGTRARRRRRLSWPVGLTAGAVLAATFAVPASAHDSDHADATDPAAAGAVSRSAAEATDPLAQDPTTPQRAAANTAAVAARRSSPDPTLLPGLAPAPRRDVPEDRYAMAGGCYGIATGGRWVVRDGDGFRAVAGRVEAATPLHFQATTLGRYLLFGDRRDFVARDTGAPPGLGGAERVVAADRPSPEADWTVTRRGTSYRFTLPRTGRALAVDRDGRLVLAATPAPFSIRRTAGCARWPEVRTNVSGRPFRGATGFAEVRGYADAHTHGMAFEFLGGEVHCGRPWHPYGVTYALRDCEDHTATAGRGAALESFLSGDPDGHDPVGWPTFRDWPAPDSLTHEGTYYRWMERSWRGGLRLFVNLLVENNKLCELYPLKRNSCDDMDSIRLQARRMRQFERYVDAQAGGPGEGWYRIVRSPFEAREVINDGKLAVVMGIETSVVFGCTVKLDVPQCGKDEIDRQLDAVHRMGVRQMELVNKFDNALSGVAGDEGTTGVAVNSANFLETGSFWRMRSCPSTYGDRVHDKEQYAVPREVSERDPLFGAIADAYAPELPAAAPVYPAAPHCNERGLTDLGRFTVRGLAERKMLFDPDHMSVRARRASLDLVDRLDYSGILSSHSWSTPDAYPRIARLGGFIAPYAGDSTGFVDKWRYHVGRADRRYFFGLGFGADINGLGAQGDPRGADAEDPVTYPFRGLGGVTVGRQVSGRRVYDVNVDGVAHYGLYPDWVEDLRRLAGGAIVEDMARGSEAYLQMWERALGVGGNGCADDSALRRAAAFRDLPRGASTRRVLFAVGQPAARIDHAYSYCARTASGERTRLRVVFDDTGRLLRVV